jgi:hypothetical protein
VTDKTTRIYGRLLDPLLIEQIFTARESMASYLNTDSILQRREIADDILSAFKELLSLEIDDDIESYIVGVWVRNSKILSKEYNQHDNLFDYLNNIDSDGVKLLELPQTINLEVLKSQYRKASKKYHPDKGGSHKEMLVVNDTFALFLDALQYYNPQHISLYDGGIPNFIPMSWQEFLFAIHLINACINGDYFAADESFLSLEKAFIHAKRSNSTQIAIVILKLSGIGGVLYKPCHILSKFHMTKELKIASKITSYLADYGAMQWGFERENVDEPDPNQFLSIDELNEISTSPVVIHHIEQANNAFRLGAIDEKRFKSVIARLERRKKETTEYQNIVDLFIADYSYVQKLSIADYDSAKPTSAVIPPPAEEQKRFDHLSDIQKWEYLQKFGEAPTAEGYDKYFTIRVQELLLGLIHNYDMLDLTKIEKELIYFSNAHDRYIPAYTILLEYYSHLQVLDPAERKKKLAMLKKVDDPKFFERSGLITMSISLEGYLEGVENPDYRNPVEVTDKYIEFAKLNSDEIEAFNTSDEYVTEYEIAVNRDRLALRTFEESEVGKEREHIWIHAVDPTRQDVINSLEPFVVGLLELGRTFHPKNTGELQLGYSINQLTTAYAAEKDWEKVAYWGDLFFNLPRHYHDWSTPSERRPLKKRIERAKRELSK